MGSKLDTYRAFIKEKIDNDDVKIPVLPKAATTIFSLSNDPNVEITKLVSLIERDQTIAGHLLRIANSAAFSPNQQITSIGQAVQWLGTKILGEITLAITLQGKFYKMPHYKYDLKRIFRHSLISAQYGKELAHRLGMNSETMYLCGLMHTMDKPVIMQIVSDHRQSNIEPLNFSEVTKLFVEFNGPINDLLSAKWELPEPIAIPVKYYLNYKEAASYFKETAATYLVNLLANYAIDPENNDAAEIKNDDVLDELGINDEKLEKLADRKEKLTEIVKSMEF